MAGFRAGNERAAEFARRHIGGLISEIIVDQRQTVRKIISTGLESGRAPSNIALDLVGRVEKGKRVGGVVGLHSRQAESVLNMRRELEELNMGYFNRTLRDKRLDGVMMKYIKEGKVPKSEIDRSTRAYSRKMLSARGEVIARTESLTALTAGEYDAYAALIESGQVRADQISITWDATGDSRTRPAHMALDGMTIGFGEFFRSPETGALMKHPRDASHGAHGSDYINCRCWMKVRVDYGKNLRGEN